ncbi:MAG: glycosyltransferase family 2 protein [Calditrichaeota bacterium]|nr:glycosyltransferase family 2 protein [Calditrichota bacterium]
MPLKHAPKIAIILLNWNNTADTLACLDSIYAGTYTDFHVFVVDNGSRQAEKQKLIAGLKSYRKITPVYLANNSGFAAGNNVALKLAILKKYDYYLLLNNDTVVAKDFLDEILTCASRHPDAGGFGARIYYFDPPDVLWYAGGTVQPMLARVTQEGFRQKEDETRWSCEKQISFITGCAFLIAHKALEDIGYLEEDFFSYFEDVEYSLRLQKNGYSLWYCPKAKVWHKVGAGQHTRAYTPYYLYYQTRNRWKAFSSGRNVFFKGYLFGLNFFLYFLGRIAYILSIQSENKKRQLKAVWLGFFHSLIGKMGRAPQWENSDGYSDG